MSAEVECRPRPLPSSFPRPTSLHVPEKLQSTPSILSASSYSRFPGAIDPHGLDQFLLPPDDPAWTYTDPTPAAGSNTSDSTSTNTSAAEVIGDESSPRLLKHRSLSMLRRPSPLSQPPVSAAQPPVAVTEGTTPRQRRRSNTVDSGSPTVSPRSLPLDVEPGPVSDFYPERSMSMTPSSSSSGSTSSKGGLKRAFTFSRKSFLGKDNAKTASDDPSKSRLSVDSLSMSPITPPMSVRSNSSYSAISSASSTSSGSAEEIKTPSEAVTVSSQVEVAGGKLAEALAGAGAGAEDSTKRKTWRGWLGGKRLSKLVPSASSSTSSLADVASDSASMKRSASSASTLSKLSTPAKSKSKSKADVPVVSVVAPSPMSRSSTERSFADIVASEQLRRLSLQKLLQLRSPSPHPLALSLKRQYSNLPDEIACSIQSGEKVFPLSVNAIDPNMPPPLNPGQGGLNTSLAIKSVLQRLEQGEIPPPLTKRHVSAIKARRTIVPRPRGVLNFISRPPFEERNVVYYQNGTFSPISMARPGYGVWDLDFTTYILALSRVDGMDPEAMGGWPIIPRASIGAEIDELAVMDRGSETEETSKSGSEETLGADDSESFSASTATPSGTPEDEKAEVEVVVDLVNGTSGGTLLPGLALTLGTPLVSDIDPYGAATEGEIDPEVAIAAEGRAEEVVGIPESSFRRGRAPIRTWAASSSESEDGDEDEDDAPLRSITHRRSFPARSSTSTSDVSALFKAQESGSPRTRAISSPGREAERRAFRRTVHHLSTDDLPSATAMATASARRSSSDWAMDKVLGDRQRRLANVHGEGERRAESEQKKKRDMERRRQSSSLDARRSKSNSNSATRESASSGNRSRSNEPVRPTEIAGATRSTSYPRLPPAATAGAAAPVSAPSLQFYPASPTDVKHGRSRSYFEPAQGSVYGGQMYSRPSYARQASAPGSQSHSHPRHQYSGGGVRRVGLEGTKRHHSFYDVSAAASGSHAAGSPFTPARATHPGAPVPFVNQHPGPGQPHSAGGMMSMGSMVGMMNHPGYPQPHAQQFLHPQQSGYGYGYGFGYGPAPGQSHPHGHGYAGFPALTVPGSLVGPQSPTKLSAGAGRSSHQT